MRIHHESPALVWDAVRAGRHAALLGAVSITDGTTTGPAVKPGSTAAVAGDKALVVSISPNNVIPTTAFDAFSRNDVLQILVFAVLFGVALALVGEPARVARPVHDPARAARRLVEAHAGGGGGNGNRGAIPERVDGVLRPDIHALAAGDR